MSDSEQSGRNVRNPGVSGASAPDRRVRRTRKLLHEAFIALAIEKGYEKTTIQDILDRADVGRSTFYTHYRDKAELLTASFDGMHEQLLRQLAEVPTTSTVDVTLPAALLFDHAYQNQRVYRALCGHQGGVVVQRHLRSLIGDLLRKQMRPEFSAGGTEVPADIAAEFYTSAALGCWCGGSPTDSVTDRPGWPRHTEHSRDPPPATEIPGNSAAAVEQHRSVY